MSILDMLNIDLEDLADDKPRGTTERNCCNCEYSQYNYIDELDHCDNEHSDYYGVEVYYDDVCEKWEEKI